MKELDTIREALEKAIENLSYYDGFDNGQWEKALAALSTIEAQVKPKTGWMIQKHNPMPMWWNGCPQREGNGAWSSEPHDGIKFSRKLDAELCAIAQGFSLSKVKIINHRWS